MVTYEQMMRRGGEQAIRQVSQFFGREDALYRTLVSVTSKLIDLKIPYAISGGLAMVAYGSPRTRLHLELVVTPTGLRQLLENAEAEEYVRQDMVGQKLRDKTTGIPIRFLVTGDFATNGEAGDIKIPDPTSGSVIIDGRPYLKLETLIDIKLIRGMVRTSSMSELADVIDLIRDLSLPRTFANKLSPLPVMKYLYLWDAVQNHEGSL
jgi:hypothetical protein